MEKTVNYLVKELQAVSTEVHRWGFCCTLSLLPGVRPGPTAHEACGMWHGVFKQLPEHQRVDQRALFLDAAGSVLGCVMVPH